MFATKPRRPYADYIVKPKAPYSTYRKHLGYYCGKCQVKKYLALTELCDCLLFEEDSKVIKAHINREWSPIYADMEVRPVSASGGA